MATLPSNRTSSEGRQRLSSATSVSIQLQLERILASPAFCNSKRYTRFLRFIVEQTLLGRAGQLKERLIGMEVFDRAPDYDMGTDSIVRVAAGEVRRRLAQYYVENAGRDELRIRLQPGSYVPEFELPPLIPPEAGEESAPANPNSLEGHPAKPEERRIRKRVVAAALGITVAVVLASAGLLHMTSRATPVERFWEPFLHSASTTMICLGDLDNTVEQRSLVAQNALAIGTNNRNLLDLGDVQAMNRVSRILVQHGAQVNTVSSGVTTLAELRRQPVVLVGGSTNQWTMRSMQLLRFQLVPNLAPGVNGIRDRDEHSKIRWQVDFNVPYHTMPRTYAIIARFVDPVTGQPTVIIDGLGAAGTLAGADFLTNPVYYKDFVDHAPKDWDSRNLEVVVEAQLINGDYGPPHVIASYLW